MNKNEMTWHNFYPNHQRKSDEERTVLTPYRRFKQILWTIVEKEGFLTKIEISQSLTNYVYLRFEDFKLNFKLSNEGTCIEATIEKNGIKIKEFIDQTQPTDVCISKFIEIIKTEVENE